MKFIQVSDLHLERPFEGIYDDENQIFPHLVPLNQQVFNNIIQLAIEKEVDFVLFCGDTFHQSQVSLKTQDYFIKGLMSLKKANIKAVLTFGNHDYYTPTKFWFEFPDNVFLFTSEKVERKTFKLEKNDEVVDIIGFSYEHQWITEDKLTEFPPKSPHFTIGIYHGSEKTGKLQQDRYAPFSLKEMARLNYDYFALGHIHVPNVLSTNPLIIYGGTPQGHSQKETKTRGVVFAEIGKNMPPTYEFLAVEELIYRKKYLSLMEVSTENSVLVIQDFLKENNTPHFQILSLELTIPDDTQVDVQKITTYLREWCREEELNIYLNQVTITYKGEERILLPLSENTLKSYQKLYQQEAFFKEEMQDFYDLKDLQPFMEEVGFQKEVVERAVEILKERLLFEEDENGNY